LKFPGEATLSDAKLSYYNKYGLNDSISYLLYNGYKLEDNDKRKIKDIPQNAIIEVYIIHTYKRKEFGKTIIGNITIKF